jgi:hypothetical protein
MRTQSNWIKTLDSSSLEAVIRQNSNAFMYQRRLDSNSIKYLDTEVRVNSNYMVRYTRVYENLYTVSSDESINDFIHFKGGITVNANKTLALAVPVSISGNITMRDNSTLILNGDITPSSTGTFIFGVSDGDHTHIQGNSRAILLSRDLDLRVHSGNQNIYIDNSLIIDGRNRATVTVGGIGSEAKTTTFHIASGQTLTLQRMKINGMPKAIFETADNTSSIVLQDCTIDLSDQSLTWKFPNSTTNDCNLQIKGTVAIRGTGTFEFAPANGAQLTVGTSDEFAMLLFDTDVEFYYNSTARDSLYLPSGSSWLYFRNAIFKTTANGIDLLRGTLAFDGRVELYNGTSAPYNADDTKAITLGNGSNADYDVDTYVMAGAQVEVYGYLHHNPAQ